MLKLNAVNLFMSVNYFSFLLSVQFVEVKTFDLKTKPLCVLIHNHLNKKCNYWIN